MLCMLWTPCLAPSKFLRKLQLGKKILQLHPKRSRFLLPYSFASISNYFPVFRENTLGEGGKSGRGMLDSRPRCLSREHAS